MGVSMSRPDEQTRRNRTKLLLIFALFLLPPVSAWVVWTYLGTEGVSATTNAGTLVSPARPLPIAGLRKADGEPLDEKDLRGRWTYVMFAGQACDQRCQQQLYLTRQVRLGMNKDVSRVQRVLVLDSAPASEFAQVLSTEHQDLTWAVRDNDAVPLLEQFRGQGFAPNGEQYFLVDPLGNLMMYYDLGVPARGMIKDLQKLLKISQIG